MSETVYSVIPTAPRRQPDRAAGERRRGRSQRASGAADPGADPSQACERARTTEVVRAPSETYGVSETYRVKIRR
ncbi:hypothetical protein ABZT06_18595 [Streptomyces sp. NPDC005483]|uniref:hypothetical protein n=1 Tax=Streptomyces sp. NPDC005483 TaxID=3154882 RepID=UPI0033B3673D